MRVLRLFSHIEIPLKIYRCQGFIPHVKIRLPHHLKKLRKCEVVCGCHDNFLLPCRNGRLAAVLKTIDIKTSFHFQRLQKDIIRIHIAPSTAFKAFVDATGITRHTKIQLFITRNIQVSRFHFTNWKKKEERKATSF